MRILQVANGDFLSSYGGGQVYFKNIVDEMIRQQTSLVVFSFINRLGTPILKRNYKGIDIYEISQLNTIEIKDLMRSIAPDVVHAHSQKAFFSLICKELSIPYIVTAHHGGITCPAGTLLNHRDEICHVKSTDKDCLPCVMKNTKLGLTYFYPWMKWIPFSIRLKLGHLLQKLPFIYFITPLGGATLHIQDKQQKEWNIIAENTDLMIAPSESIAENMVLNGMDQRKIVVIPHGIPIYLSDRNSDLISNCEDKKIVKFFYVGRICYVKGIHVLLNAFSQLNQDQCELHLIGALGDKYQHELQKKYSRNKNVFFHGKIPMEQVGTFIRSFDVLVHPAIYLEVFGLNIAEALSESKPVIATRCGGAEMQIEDRVNGLLIPPNDVQALYDAMMWVKDNPNQVVQMSKNAPRRVISMEEHVCRLIEIYKTQIANLK